MASITVSREAGVVIVTRTSDEGQQTVTGHDLCAAPDDAAGLALACLLAASTDLYDVVDTLIHQFAAAGITADLDSNDPSEVLMARAIIARSKAVDGAPASGSES